MKHQLFLFMVFALGIATCENSCRAEAPGAGVPKVVLQGESDTELAPHLEGNVYAPCVLSDGALYRMWYGGQGKDGHDRIHYAESADGEAWARKGVVLEDRKANHVNDPSVVKVDGVYFMYYTRTEKDVVDRVDLAISTDGIAWEPKGVALAAGEHGSWDALSVGRPSVLHEDGVFKMWYDGRKDFPPGAPVKDVPKSSTSSRSVGYATSKDGVHFSRFAVDPVFANDAGGVDVKRWGSGFIMAYESRDGTRIACSKNGIRWTDAGLLAAKSNAPIDAFGHVTPFLLIDREQKMQRLYFGAARGTTWDRNAIAVLPFPADRLNNLIAEPANPGRRRSICFTCAAKESRTK